MSTESAKPQETTPGTGEVESHEADRPNEYGFAGGATTPSPAGETAPTERVDGETVAVPAGDLTGALTAAIEHATTDDDES
jgi:hypothetical protein